VVRARTQSQLPGFANNERPERQRRGGPADAILRAPLTCRTPHEGEIGSLGPHGSFAINLY